MNLPTQLTPLGNPAPLDFSFDHNRLENPCLGQHPQLNFARKAHCFKGMSPTGAQGPLVVSFPTVS